MKKQYRVCRKSKNKTINRETFTNLESKTAQIGWKSKLNVSIRISYKYTVIHIPRLICRVYQILDLKTWKKI